MCILQIQYVMHFPVINKMTFCFNWRSLGRGGCLFRDILGNLRESAYLHQAKGHHNSLIALYHAGMANKDLEYILHEFSKPDSILRLIICTIAFGMGINIPDIEVVVHWGACDSMMTIGKKWAEQAEMVEHPRPCIMSLRGPYYKHQTQWRSCVKL